MAHRNSTLAGKFSPLDIKRPPLSVRSIGPRRSTPVSIKERVRDEFNEMRGLSPTLQQAARLFDLAPDECDRVLRSLVQDGSLRYGEDGRYRLVS